MGRKMSIIFAPVGKLMSADSVTGCVEAAGSQLAVAVVGVRVVAGAKLTLGAATQGVEPVSVRVKVMELD